MNAKQWIFPEALSPQAQTTCAELATALQLPPILAQVLWQRGIQTLSDAQHFLHAGAEELHQPFLMQDMHRAVERLHQAIEGKEKILLYGDYDVDGTSAVALLYRFLEATEASVDYYIPDRYREGYGLSRAGVEYARDQKIDLLLCLDCGIKAHENIQLANDFGIQVIVCDHHLPGETLPPAFAILDPKRPGDNYPFSELCGTGVAFKLAQAYALSQGWPDSATDNLLDLVVVATASDIVPLIGENRILARLGLQQLNAMPSAGLAALIRQSRRVQPLGISDVVFGLGPMINAAGRLGDAREAVRLLLAKDPLEAEQLAVGLDRRNEDRKAVDRAMAEEARSLFLAQPDWEARKSIVLYQKDWHKGVVGIVASRMVDWFQRPSIILTESEGKIVGSARSVRGFDLHEALGKCAQHFSNFGGHRYAAGLTLATGNFEAFQADFEKIVEKNIDPQSLQAEIRLAGALELAAIDFDFWRQLQRLAPFGPGHRSPVFWTEGVEDNGYARLLKEQHLKFSLNRPRQAALPAIAFGQGESLATVQGGRFNLCYTLQDNFWQGQHSLQLQVRDLQAEK